MYLKGHMYITPVGQRRAKQIRELADQGKSPVEIARVIGINRQRVCKIAERYAIPLSRHNSRRVTAYVSLRRAGTIQTLADEAKVSPAVMVDYAVRLLVDDGIDAARKRLGKLSTPTKQYNKAKTLQVQP